MDNATTQIQKRMAELPPDIQAAIQSADLGAKLHAIGTKHKLHIDQVGELEDEVLLAMLGFSPIEALPKKFEQGLKLPEAEAQALGNDVGTEIFGPIRESMKKFTESRNAPSVTPDTKPAAVVLETPATPAKATPVAPVTPADVMLSEKTVSVPPSAPVAEKPVYKTDPYREPPL